MRLLQNRVSIAAVALIAFTGMFTAACGHVSGGVGVSVQPYDLPIQFAVDLTFEPGGGIAISGSVGIITEIGIISVQGSLETNLQPDPNETLLIIKHHFGNGLVYSVYRIRTGEEVTVTLNGHVVITVTNRKIVIDAASGSIKRIEVQNAPLPAPPAVAKPAPASPGTVQLVKTIQPAGMDITSVAWSPDGTMFADAGYSTTDPQVAFVSQIRRASSGALAATHLVPDYWLNTVSWSPNGQYIAGGYDSDVQIWSASTGRQVSEIGYWASSNISWSPDSQYLVTSGQGQPTAWSATSGSQISSYDADSGYQETAVWSPTGNLIVSDDVIWNGMTGQAVRTYAGNLQGNDFQASAWSPNGQEIASAEGIGGPIVVWDTATGATIWQGQENLDATGLSWSPNGKYIAWLANGQAGILAAATGRSIVTFGSDVPSMTNDTGGSQSPSIAWSPNGEYIVTATGSGPVQVWKAPNWSY